MLAGAVGETAALLRERIVAIAAHRLEASPEDIVLAQSRAHARGTPSTAVSLAEIADFAYFKPGSLPPGVPPGLEASARYRARRPMIWANATHVCTCEVDVMSGAVTLRRYIVSEDCGPMINPNVVEGQIAGGVVQGILGSAPRASGLRRGREPARNDVHGLLLPTSTDVPTIEYGHVETPAPGPGGFKGVGEGGAIGAPPAVVHAIADALVPFGVEIRRLPLTPSAIVELIEGAR
jgi:carbon-monoxide dehydrogenase large subunit